MSADQSINHYASPPAQLSNQSICPFACMMDFLSFRPRVRLSVSHPIRTSVHPYVCVSFNLSTQLSVYLLMSVRLSVCPSFHPSVFPSARLSVRPSFCPPVFPSVRLSVRLSFNINILHYVFQIPIFCRGFRHHGSGHQDHDGPRRDQPRKEKRQNWGLVSDNTSPIM